MIVIQEHVMATEAVSEMMARECIAMRVRLLTRVVTKIYDDCMRPHGLRTAQLNILVAISLMKSATPSEIERRLHLEKSTVSRNVERMRQQGWVEFVPAEDGRSHHLHLTVQGTTLLRKTTVAWEQAQKQAVALLGKEGVTALSRLGVTRGAHAG
jgi:DNA-binding MarR family transcriptional regulator